MPEKETLKRARRDEREGKAPSTQADEFVREEMDHIREGMHGARSTKQAIGTERPGIEAIGEEITGRKSCFEAGAACRRVASCALQASEASSAKTQAARDRYSGQEKSAIRSWKMQTCGHGHSCLCPSHPHAQTCSNGYDS
jgi:hypothetical protein